MDNKRTGTGLRAIRARCGRTQRELSIAAGVPRNVVQAVEGGRLERVRIGDLQAIASALDANVDLILRWRGGDLGRLVNARHARLHEVMASRFSGLGGWRYEPEVSFSLFGERGVIDGLAWHPATGTLLVIELKSELVDLSDLMGTVDRKRRLAPEIGRARGWQPRSVSCWVAIEDGRTNRRALARHASTLRAKFPTDGRTVEAWLRRPDGAISALSFLSDAARPRGNGPRPGARLVRHAHEPHPER